VWLGCNWVILHKVQHIELGLQRCECTNSARYQLWGLCNAESTHTFTANDVDWGFKEFLPLKDVLDPARGFLVDDILKVAPAS
jgi:hypothetical protein